MKTIILKVGTSTLTRGTNRLSRGKIEDIARQILALRDRYKFIIVSSGAIATARQFIQLTGGSPIAVKQALSAIGQPVLSKIYQEIFNDFGLKTAQCLVNYRDVDNDKSRKNIVNAINVLLENNYIPIINENDTVATDEIQFGDNDKLSALMAGLLEVDLLVIASDINGLYDKDPNQHADAKIIPKIHDVKPYKHLEKDSDNGLGTGGIRSKLIAAEICLKNGIEMWIVNGFENRFLEKVIDGEVKFTRVVGEG